MLKSYTQGEKFLTFFNILVERDPKFKIWGDYYSISVQIDEIDVKDDRDYIFNKYKELMAKMCWDYDEENCHYYFFA